MRKTMISVFELGVVLSLCACGSTDFGNGVSNPPTKTLPGDRGSGDQNPEATPTAGTDNTQSPTPTPAAIITPAPVNPYFEATDDFFTDFQKPKVDIVWTIDNSESMVEEAALVRKNFSSFISQTSEQVDMRLFLLSNTYNPNASYCENYDNVNYKYLTNGLCGVSFAANQLPPQFVQIPSIVASTNAMAVAASASCKLSESFSDGGGLTLCGKKLSGSVEDTTSVLQVAGSLAALFRTDAERAYVFVTDDNAAVVGASNFVSLVSGSASKSPFAFAFRGISNTPYAGNPNCDVAQDGLSYDRLASQTGGAVYDICAPDWSANFKDLSSRIAKLKSTVVTLSHDQIESVQTVRLEGELIPNDKYTLDGNKLTIAPGLVLAKGQHLTITYTVKH